MPDIASSVTSPEAVLPGPATTKRASGRTIFALCCIWSGLIVTEAVSNNVLPLTIRQFTDQAWLIGLILAINPAFGFIAQPLVGIVSDRIWTPIGRRAFFLVTGAPVVALCLVLVPGAQVLWHLIVLVVLYQFFQDVLWGSDHPLLADLVPPAQRTLVTGLMTCLSQVATYLFLRQGMPRLSIEWLYYVAALCQVVLVAGGALFLKERRNVSHRPKLTVRRYVLDVMGDRSLRRFAAVSFTQMLFTNVIAGFVVLFAVQNLSATRAEFGEIWSFQSLLALFTAIPLAIAVERYLPKHWALGIGYTVMMSACVLGLLAQTLTAFLVITIIWGAGALLTNVTLKPFMTEFIPPDIIGQVTGALNVFFALGRTAALLGGGTLISILGNDYRHIWSIALFFGAITVGICLSLPDLRYQARKNRRPEASAPISS